MTDAQSPRPLLEVENLAVALHLRRGDVRPVDGVSLTIREGETLGIVGESGSGKSMTGSALLGLLPNRVPASVTGRAWLDGEDLLTLSERELQRRIRGRRIALIAQDPMMSLNPVWSVGDQVAGPLRHHGLVGSRAEARERAVGLLERVAIPSARERLDEYPHQFSGGMRQRAVAAMALGCEPRLLIADEPTTALDVTIQLQVMSLLKRLQRETGVGIMLITHDLGVAAGLCHRIAVMYGGRIVETGPTDDILARPEHPYTRALIEAAPRMGARRERLRAIPGQPPSALQAMEGCRFAPRCPHAMEICRRRRPEPLRLGRERTVECWLADATTQAEDADA
ncbi:ABC transporter ATP-binding protein [uncultured Albimonas sp.]|uniref:ABC transporter ATP-binding protein n=1 Tax=uncultured Albimonas sp. TaxID=1331701 RepID=UPI0030ED3462